MKKVTISGSYRTADRKIIDYSNLTGLVPDCEDDVLDSVVQNRYAKIWLEKDDKYKERVTGIRECYIDKVEDVDGTPSFIGRDIKEMSFEELQDLATVKGLRSIPLYKAGSLRDAQMKAYKIYSKAVLGYEVDDETRFMELPAVIVDGKVRTDRTMPDSNEKVLEVEQKRSALTLDDLKKIAKSKGITFHPNIKYDALYAKIYN